MARSTSWSDVHDRDSTAKSSDSVLVRREKILFYLFAPDELRDCWNHDNDDW